MKRIRYLLIYLFIFLGPIGNIIPIPIKSFRVYYLLLPLGILSLITIKHERKFLRIILAFIPFMFYVLLSSSVIPMAEPSLTTNIDSNPLIRFGLFFLLFMFTILAGSYVSSFPSHEKFRLLLTYLKAYSVSLVVGYMFYIGYYRGIFSLNFMEHFHVLLQFGYGILRFSPGSYPNEYGTVSSFILAILTMLYVSRKDLRLSNLIFTSRIRSILFFIFYFGTLIALFLATTRAAYISFACSVVYIAFTTNNKKYLIRTIAGLSTFLGLLLWYIQTTYFNFIAILLGGYYSFSQDGSSSQQRFEAWSNAYTLFKESPLFGVGFSLLGNNIHNTYLQIIFELGLFGLIIFFITITYLFITRQVANNHNNLTVEEKLLWQITNLALLHVLWFAVSNHNLNHHLTWFTFFLLLMRTPANVHSRLRYNLITPHRTLRSNLHRCRLLLPKN